MKLIFGVHTPEDARKSYKNEQRIKKEQEKAERKRQEELEQALAEENKRKQFPFVQQIFYNILPISDGSP